MNLKMATDESVARWKILLHRCNQERLQASG